MRILAVKHGLIGTIMHYNASINQRADAKMKLKNSLL